MATTNSQDPLTSTVMEGGLRNMKIQSGDDATWCLTSAFIIFTMQSGKSLASHSKVYVYS